MDIKKHIENRIVELKEKIELEKDVVIPGEHGQMVKLVNEERMSARIDELQWILYYLNQNKLTE